MPKDFEPSTEWRAIDSITPYANNTKTHPTEQVDKIAGSIAKFGFDQPIVVDGDGVIIKGHGRREAAIRLGLKHVPVIRRQDLSDAEAKAARIADNKTAESPWDTSVLSLEIQELDQSGFELEPLGFDQEELDNLLNPPQEGGTEGNTDPDEVPEAPEEPETKPGDVWILGDHRLLCGDATNAEHVERLMGGDKAELCFTSPPYADQREYNGGKDLSTEYLATFVRAAYGQCDLFAVNLGVSRKEGEVNRYWDDYISEAENCGLKLLSWNVWNKGVQGSIGQLTAMFPIAHEWIFVFGSQSQTLNKTIENKTGGNTRDVADRQKDGSIKSKPNVTVSDKRALGTVFDSPGEMARNHGANHPAMFPVVLPEAYIEACTNGGRIVYEPFAGSGSTLIACEKTGRKCFGMEIDPHYCDVIKTRWENFTGRKAELENGPSA